jgi:mannitol-specific phosphotransferase system IIBC component
VAVVAAIIAASISGFLAYTAAVSTAKAQRQEQSLQLKQAEKELKEQKVESNVEQTQRASDASHHLRAVKRLMSEEFQADADSVCDTLGLTRFPRNVPRFTTRLPVTARIDVAAGLEETDWIHVTRGDLQAGPLSGAYD